MNERTTPEREWDEWTEGEKRHYAEQQRQRADRLASVTTDEPWDERIVPWMEFTDHVLTTGAMRHRLPHPSDDSKCAACRIKNEARLLLMSLAATPLPATHEKEPHP